MKVKKVFSIFEVVASFCIIVFTLSCDVGVGLGSAVDVESPTVKITYPPESSVIKDYFVLSGSCEDDRGVKTVYVTVKKSVTTSDKDGKSSTDFVTVDKFENLEAEISEKEWKIKLNQPDEDGTFPLLDGKYIIEAVAVDEAKRKSNTFERSFEIDNSAPVFIIKNPGTTSESNPSSYGSVFKITGTIADDHEINAMDVKIFDENGTAITDWTESNVEVAGGTEIVFARYNKDASSGEDTLNDRYNELYGDSQGQKNYKCQIYVSDVAKTYQNPENVSESEKNIGNKTSALMLNADVYEEFMGKNSEKELTASDIKKILNGTYSESQSARMVQNEVEEYKNRLLEKLVKTEEKNLCFSLNKVANPKYSIVGYAYDYDSSSISKNKASKKGKVTLKATYGLDQTNFKTNTIKVYLFGPYDSVSQEEAEKIYLTPNSYYETEREKAKEALGENATEELIDAQSKTRILLDNTDQKEGEISSVSNYTQEITLPDVITKGKQYIFCAVGNDEDGVEFLSEGFFGFVGESAGFAPTLDITSPQTESLSKELPQITGKISSEESTISKIEYSVTVKDELKKTDVGTITGTASALDGSFDSASEEFIIDLTKGEGYETCAPKENSIYKYEVTLKGYDSTDLYGTDSLSFRVDLQKPEIKINSVLPVAKTEENVNFINGKITLTGNITESYFESGTLTVSRKDEKFSKDYPIDSTFISQIIDTREFNIDDDDGVCDIVITITAKDQAGNQNTLKDETYRIDQSTDKPQISCSNAQDSTELADNWNKISSGVNLFGKKSNNTMNFVVTDDDGIKSVNIVCYEDDKKTEISKKYYTELEGKTSASISYKLPEDFADYYIVITVVDTEFGEENDKSYCVAVNESVFNLRFMDISGSSIDVSTKAQDVKCSMSISKSQLKSIEKYEYVKNAETGKNELSSTACAKYESGAEDNTISLTEENGKLYFVDTLKEGSDGTKTYCYKVSDNYNSTESIDLTVNVDDKAPSASVVGDYSAWSNNASQTVEVFAGDALGTYNSGLDEVSYSYNKSGESKITGVFVRSNNRYNENKKEDKDGLYYIYKTTIGFEDGEYTLNIVAKDNVGNENKELKPSIRIDTTSPTADVSISENQVLNKSKNVSVTYSAKDLMSGLKSIKISSDSKLSDAKEITLSGTNLENQTYEFDISSLKKDGEYNIYVQAEDNAGNKSEIMQSASFTVDNTAPEVTVKTPSSLSEVNKTISLTGTVKDNNLDSKTVAKFYYKNGENWTEIKDTTTTIDGQNWTISGFDTTTLNKTTTESTVEFKVTFADKAGNANESLKESYSLKINQNADRPVIKLTNINISGSAISSNVVMGTISDDDGDVSKLYRIDKKSYESDSTKNKTPSSENDWKEITVEKGTGVWKTTLDSSDEGKVAWYFYVIDAQGGTFFTQSSSELERIYLSDSSKTKVDNTDGISFFFDKTAPKVQLKLSHDGKDWTSTNTVYGGKESVYVKVLVYEAVGMASEDPVVLTIGGVQQNGVTGIESSETGYNLEYDFGAKALSSYSSGTLSISVEATDSASQKNKEMMNITVDKTAPTVKIISPTTSLSDAVSSAISVKGIVQDDYSSIERLQYAIPKKNTEDANQEWKDTTTASSWEIQFTSGALDTSDSLVYYAQAEYNYAIEETGTENIYKVPIWFKVIDSSGNDAIYKDSYVLVDSDGGKPKAWINSPEDGSTTSGKVTIYGGSSDNVSVSAVYVQIDADNDGDFDTDDKSYIESSWNETDVYSNLKEFSYSTTENGETVTNSDWGSLANGTSSWKLVVDTDKLPGDSKKLRFRVRALDNDSLSREWSKEYTITIDSQTPTIKDLKLVQFGKDVTNPTTETAIIVEREYVSGLYISNNSVSENGPWYLMGSVSDNESVASISFNVISSSTSNNISLVDGSEINPGKDSYTFLKELKTSDTGVISYQIKATDNSSGSATASVTINIDNTSPSLYNTSNTETSQKSEGNLRLKSLSKVIGKGDSNSTVVNNNNYFTFGDTVNEAGSGLDYVAFYFMRKGATETRVYNPIANTTLENKTVISEKPENPSTGDSYINSDGLACIYVEGSRSSQDSITFTLPSVNKNIRKGELIKIGGTYSLITEGPNPQSSDNTMTVKFSPTASESFTTAEIILAQVVDHQITESISGTQVLNDDGDEMCESISQIGSSYTWTASVNSTNIPDGPITICVVAFDKAGNINSGSIETKVENNRPRIAKVLLGTDLNSNGKYDWSSSSEIVNTGDENSDTKNGKAFGEFSFYSALDTNTGKIQSTVTLDSNSFKVIDGLCIIPEFVGGNTSLKYILENPTDLSSATKKEGTELTDLTAKSTLLEKISQKGTVKIEDYITSFGGIDLTSLNSGNISLTFWDETEETVQGKTSQWALLKIPVSVMTKEKEIPVPVITPFYWNSKTDNSVYINDAISGHIELEGDLTASIKNTFGDSDSLTKPKVSGKLKIEGTVTDNVRVSSIDMSFVDLFANKTLANYISGEWKNVDSLPNGVVSFAAEDVSISQEGHTVKYTLIVDTEKLNNVAGKAKAIKISAKDWKENKSDAGTVQTTASAKTALYTVDVVPYVTGIGTELSAFYRSASSVYARTSTGRYPLHESEDITLYGYNLSSSSVSLNGTSLSAGSTAVSLADTDVKGGANTVTITTGTEATSGAFTVTVNSISAINNTNNNNAEYNQQPNGVNNNILTDDIYADVWQFKNAAEPVNGGANYVTMKINPKTGVPGFSYANSILYFNMPGYEADHTNATAWGAENATIGGNQYSQIPFGMNYGGFSYNSFTFDNYGYSYGAAMCTDTQSAKASAFLQFFSRETPIKYNSFDQNMNYVNCANASRLDSSTVQISSGDNGWVTDIDRIQSISMETTHASISAPDSTNPTYVYMAYYDKSAKQVRFRWGTVGGATDNIDGKANSSSSASFTRVGKSYGLDDVVGSQYTGYAQGDKNNGSLRPSSVSDSFVKYSNTNNNGVPIQVVAATGISGALDYYKTATTYAAGQYVSLAIIGKDTSSPTAVVAWYDSKNMQLCMAYNQNPTTSNTWTSKVIDSNGGINVKIIADSDGGLHFAYYDNKGGSDLKYAYMSSLTSDPQIVTVDSYGSVGAKCTIDLAKNDSGKWVPYIGYQMNAYLGTPLAAKVAYLPEGSSDSVPAGSDNSDFYTGKWEISIVPTSNIPNDDLINVGVWRDSNGKAQKFTSNTDWTKEDTKPGTTISNSTLNVGNATILHGNNTSNPIIGYGIDTGAIEMAQKK